MEDSVYVASTSASTTPIGMPSIGFDIFALFGELFGGGEKVSGFFTGDGLLGFLSSIWTVFAIFAYLITIVLLVIYVFASVRRNLYLGLIIQGLRDSEKLYDEKYRGIARNSRLQDILNHSTSDNPNDWKLAIIEADIILDDILKKRGYVGSSLGERLKNVANGQLETIDDAWEAHKVRNRIAHDGADFILTRRISDETISRYQRVFKEFGVV